MLPVKTLCTCGGHAELVRNGVNAPTYHVQCMACGSKSTKWRTMTVARLSWDEHIAWLSAMNRTGPGRPRDG